jgi:NADH-quinone oxidoreductase subunit N
MTTTLLAMTPTLTDPAVNESLRSIFPLIIPEMVLIFFACVLFILSTVKPSKTLGGGLALVALLVSAWAATLTSDFFGGLSSSLIPTVVPILGDNLALFVRAISILAGFLLVMMSWNDPAERRACDHHACLLCVVAGLSLVGTSNDLIFLFLALELISIPTYILLYLPKYEDKIAQEAAVKYFMMSIFSSAILLFGFSYLYGLTGTTNIRAMVEILPRVVAGDQVNMALIATVFVLAGLGFRITAFPFHFYAPDVYQGGPTGTVAMLAFVPKVAGFTAMTKIFGNYAEMVEAAPVFISRLMLLLWVFAAITMTMGNILALLQTNLKRMLAYSSVANSGYMLMGVAILPTQSYRTTGEAIIRGDEAIYFYLTAYGIMTIGAFAVIAAMQSKENPVEKIDDLSGLHETNPRMAFSMAIFLFSMIGLPLTAGFVGKFLLFLGTMSTPPEAPLKGLYPLLAIVGALNAAIAAFYYLRIIGFMYLRSAHKPISPSPSASIKFCVVICAVLTVLLGLVPSLLLEHAKQAVVK